MGKIFVFDVIKDHWKQNYDSETSLDFGKLSVGVIKQQKIPSP